jgi:hypothetical protein
MRIAPILLAALALGFGTARADAASFSSQEVEIIMRYYEGVAQPDARPKAQRGRSSLPRGIAKNLARGKTLPPGIAKQYLPEPLLGRLPPPPQGFERIVVAGKILLIETATQVVHDVLTDVLFR